MYDVSSIPFSLKTAKAVAIVFCSAETMAYLRDNETELLRLHDRCEAAGAMGLKLAPQLFPLLPSAPVEAAELRVELFDEERHLELLPAELSPRPGIVIIADLKSIGRTAIENEALATASAAALAVFERLKGSDSTLELGCLKLVPAEGRGPKKKFFNTPPVCAVLVCSGSAAEGKREDKSGRMICDMLRDHRAEVKYYEVLPDDAAAIQKKIMEWVREDVHFIFTSGGTGLGPHDNAVSAVKAILERDADGVTEAMRSYGQLRTPMAMMSRSVAGSIAQTLVVTLPGSSAGARQSLEAVLPALFHARKMMKAGGH